jgi:hypothetical protein
MGFNSDGGLASEIYVGQTIFGLHILPFFSNLILSMIDFPKCPFPMMISDYWDKTTPSSMITKLIGKYMAFSVSIATMFLVGYPSHRVLQHFPCPHPNQ